MKLLLLTTALCVFNLHSYCQNKPVLNNSPKITTDCNSKVRFVKVEYKPFIDFMREEILAGNTKLLNFHIKYTNVKLPDLVMVSTDYPDRRRPSLTADFLVNRLDCIDIIMKNVEFETLSLTEEIYNLSLKTATGVLQMVNIITNTSNSFQLNPIGFGIYTGSIKSLEGGIEYKKTVVIILTKELLNL